MNIPLYAYVKYCIHEGPQAYLSRVEVEVFGHLLQRRSPAIAK